MRAENQHSSDSLENRSRDLRPDLGTRYARMRARTCMRRVHLLHHRLSHGTNIVLYEYLYQRELVPSACPTVGTIRPDYQYCTMPS